MRLDFLITLIIVFTLHSFAGPYPPAAGNPGSTAIYKASASFSAWATGSVIERGLLDITQPSLGYVTHGSQSDALGKADGTSFDTVSLGDGGVATLTFENPITNGQGFDFAVFENGFTQTDGGDFLELAFVEVSSDGINFFRFEAVSLTPTNSQLKSFQTIDPTNIHNLAGKYLRGYGTPFDLDELKELSPLLDVNSVTHVRVIDVVGYVDPADIYGDGIVDFYDYSILLNAYFTQTGDQRWNPDCDIHRVFVDDVPPYYELPDGFVDFLDFQFLATSWLNENDFASSDIKSHQINDPWPTPYDIGGFDLDAVGVIHEKIR